MSDDLRVAVIMPAYNADKTIKRAIESIRNQSYKYWVLYIIDDCSTDNTQSEISSFSYDARIKYFRNEKNSGVSSARNRGLDSAKEELITFIDSDDVWGRDKLELQLSLFKKGNDFIFSNYNFITNNKKTIVKSKKNEIKTTAFLMKEYRVCFSSVFYKKDPITENIRFKMIGHEDFLFLYELFCHFGVARICENPMVDYYVGDNSLSSDKKKAIKWQWKLLKIIFNRDYHKILFYFLSYAYRGWQFNKGRY